MNKKKIIKTAIFTIVIICSLSIQACVARFMYLYFPIVHIETRNTDRYMKVNSFVKKRIKEDYVGALPEKSLVKKNGTEYYYEYLAEKFLIYVKAVINDDSEFEAEKERIEDLSENSIPLEDGSTLYDVQNLASDHFVLMEYKNDKIYDGIRYDFEMVIIYEEENTIEYLVASIWEGMNDFDYDIIPKFVFPLQEYYSEESA